MKIFPSHRKNSRVLRALASPTIRYLMRVSLVISCLLVLSLQLSALHSNGQTIDQIEVTLEFRNAKLSDVIRQIQNKAGINFVYSPDHVNAWKHITVAKEKRTVKKLLDLVLSETTLTYKEEAGTVVIVKRSETSIVDPEKPSAIEQVEFTFSQIAGTVKDRNSVPLPGVNVVVKGTTRGTSTDADGKFTVDVSEGEVLVLSFIGYKTLEIPTENRSIIEVIMEEDVTTLRAVEVIGTDYFSTTKEKSTMNISKVEGKDIENIPSSTLLSAVVGRIPGLDITPVNGSTGGAPSIQIRGNNSLNLRGSYPLLVIDGIQIDSRPLQSSALALYAQGYDPLSSISTSDIESIEVLKDAAATAIYGSRGANGVIRITTKRAKYASKTNLNLSAYSGQGKMPHRVDLLNRDQYMEMRHEAFKNDGQAPNVFLHPDLTGVWDSTRATDWQKVLLGGTARISDIQGSFDGGSELNSFRLGAGYHKESTIYPGDDFGFRRANADISFRHRSFDKRLEILVGANYGLTNNKSYDNADYVSLALQLPPVAPKLYLDDGTLNWQVYSYLPTYTASSWDNPLAKLLSTAEVTTRNLLANTTLSYELVPGLKIQSIISLSNTISSEVTRIPIAAAKPEDRVRATATSNFNNNDRTSIMIEPQISYSKTLGKSSLRMLVGGTWQNRRSSYRSVGAYGYPSDALLGSLIGAKQLITAFDEQTQYRYASVYSHINFDFDGRYLVDLVGRRDGSSRFGPGKRYGNFGAIGLGWIFSQADMMTSLAPYFSFGKMRASYGITGNDQIGDYKYLDTYSVMQFGYDGGVSLRPTALYNPDYAWEITKKLEAALEMGFIDNKISLEVSWYRNISSNQLVQAPISAIAGFNSVLENFAATIENRGFECVLSTVNFNRNRFRWRSSLNLSIPTNELARFDGIEGTPYATMYKVGEPLSIQRHYVFKGLNSETGLFEVEDRTSDGVINDNDRKFMDPLGRSKYWGVLNSVSYGRFDFSFLLQISSSYSNAYLPDRVPGSMANQQVDVLDRWQSEGDQAKFQRFISGYSDYYSMYLIPSDLNYVDASFVRLKNASISYTFEPGIAAKGRMKEARIFLQGQNLLTITNYPGLDPETGNRLPPLRTITAGLQIKL